MAPTTVNLQHVSKWLYIMIIHFYGLYQRTHFWLKYKVVKYADHSSMSRLLQQDERLYNDWDVKSDWS